MEKYLGHYKGIVIQNDDPGQGGKIKAWCPHLSMTLYDKWNNDRNTDKKFTGLGGNLNCSLTPDLILRLKNALPWAVVKQPIFGMGTSLTYHSDIDFSEPKNDSDSSVQQKATNKLPGSSDPINNPPANTAASVPSTPPSNNANNLNNASSFSNTTPSYITNSANSSPSTGSTTASSSGNNVTKKDNINSVTITFTPNSRNAANINRKFTTSAIITNSNGTQSTASASGTNTSNTPMVALSPPITYAPATAKPTSQISVTFVPNSRNAANVNRKFTTSATIINLDGSGNITVNADATGVKTGFTVHSSQINSIGISYDAEGQAINLASPRLGQLANLLANYTTPPTTVSSSSNNVVAPPSTVPAKSYNAGGGGSELFSLISSTLLPISTMINNLIKGVNVNNVQGINYKKDLSATVDPNKTMGSNQQSPADPLPPMRSNTQTNKAKGMISIPAVGSHVSVYFDNGDPLYPIIDGVFYSQQDYQGIHDISSK